MSDLIGKRFGKYEIRERLGRGGMADVYKAYQPGMDRFVALKVLHGHLAEADDFIERFRREAQSVGQLRHPHILNVIDFDAQDDVYYMVMEFISGGTLKEYISEQSYLSPYETVRIAMQIADALSYAHQRGMVHRDIKPANIMFTDQNHQNAVLTDFGIARILDASSLTVSGVSVGTPAYMSPEAGKGESQDERSDLYSLGIVIYEMLKGKVPFSADTPYAIIVKHIHEPLPSLQSLKLPSDLEQLILKTTAKNPSERFQSAQELRDQLAKLQLPQRIEKIDETTPTYTDELPTTMAAITDSQTIITLPPASPPQRPWQLILGVVGILAIFIVGLIALTNGGSEDEPTPTPVVEAEITQEATDEVVATEVEPTEEITSEAIEETVEAETSPEFVGTTFEELSPEAQTCYTEGEQALQNGELEAAVQGFSCVIELAPNFLDGYLQRAGVYSYFDSQAALADLDRALELSPENPDIYQGRAGLNRSMENFDQALADYTQAIELRETASPYLFASRGEIYLWQGAYEEAIDNYAQAIALDPNIGEFQLMLAQVYLEMGQGSDALLFLETAATLSDTNQADVSYAKGRAYRQLGQLETALTEIESAIEQQPDQAEFFVGLGEVQMELENPSAAIDALTHSIELGNDYTPHVFYSRGLAYHMIGEDELAIEDVNKAIELDGGIGEFYAGRGDIWFEQGNVDLAQGDYEQAIELGYDSHPDMLHNLGLIYLDNRFDAQAALEYLQRATELEPAGYLFFDLGRALVGAGDFEAAISAYDTAIELGEDGDNVFESLGYAYLQAEDYETALAKYEMALELNPDNPYAYLGRGDVYTALENFDLALADYNKALEYEFESKVYVYGNRANLYLKQEAYDLAITDYKAALELNNTIFYLFEGLGQAYDAKGEFGLALETFRLGVQVAENSGIEVPQTMLDRIQELEAE